MNKKIHPDRSVPPPPINKEFINRWCTGIFNIKEYSTIPVIHSSIKLASSTPGIDVVIEESMAQTKVMTLSSLKLESCVNTIQYITNKKSGFIKPIKGGVIRFRTSPRLLNNVAKISFRVFMNESLSIF